MKYTTVLCDICGKDMSHSDQRYKFKRIEDDYGYGVIRRKLDMCETCFNDLKSFVYGNNQLRKDGQPPVVIHNPENE